MTPRLFEDFLQEWHMKDYDGTADNAPEAYEEWLAALDQDTLIQLADVAIREAEIRGLDRGVQIALDALSASE